MIGSGRKTVSRLKLLTSILSTRQGSIFSDVSSATLSNLYSQGHNLIPGKQQNSAIMKRSGQESHQTTDPGKRRKRDMGRNEWRLFDSILISSALTDCPRRQSKGKQGRNNGERRDRRGYPSKTTDADTPDLSLTHEGEAAETRRPKRKVAVMMGYSGTGYQGMQVLVRLDAIAAHPSRPDNEI